MSAAFATLARAVAAAIATTDARIRFILFSQD
jgi:hypothetical protein